MKNWTNSDQYFQTFHCQKRYICNCGVFIQLAHLQMSFVEIICRLLVEKSLIEIKFPIIFNTWKVSPISVFQTSYNCANAAQLQLGS